MGRCRRRTLRAGDPSLGNAEKRIWTGVAFREVAQACLANAQLKQARTNP